MRYDLEAKIAFWLEKVIVGLLFLTPFAVLIVADGLFFPFITGKAFFFRLLVEVAFCLWLILLLFDRAYLPKRSLLLTSISFFVLIIALADFSGVNPRVSFFSNFERMEGLVALLHIWAYVILLASLLRTEKIWHFFLKTVVGVSVLVGGYGLLQLMGTINISQGGSRLDATLGNSAYLGTFMFFTFFLTLWLWWKSSKQQAVNIAYGLILFLQLIVLYYSGTRGAIIGFGTAWLVILTLFLFNKKTSLKLKKITGALLGSLILLSLLFYTVRDTSFIQSQPVLKRFADISLTEKTVRSRFMIWDTAWQGFKERPILGWGQDNFMVVFSKYYNPKMYDQEPWFDRTHNIFFDWLIAGGILGLLGYLSIYFVSFKKLFSGFNFDFGEKAIFGGLLLGYLVQNFFVFDNLTSYILFFSTITFIGHKDNLSELNKKTSWAKIEQYPYLRYVIGLVILGLFLWSANFFVLKPYLASRSLINALVLASRGDLNGSLEFYKKAINYNTIGKIEAQEQLASLAVSVAGNSDVPIELKTNTVLLAEEEVKKQVAENLSSARALMFAGDLMNALGKFDEAIKYYDGALALSPKRQSFMVSKASVYLNKKDLSTALELLKEALAIEKSNDEIRVRYAILLFESGNKLPAEQLLIERYDTLAVNHDLLLNYYVKEKRYDLVKQIWQLRLEADKTNLQNWIAYAGSLLLLNQKSEAVSILEEAISYLPNDQIQLSEMIEHIKFDRFKFD